MRAAVLSLSIALFSTACGSPQADEEPSAVTMTVVPQAISYPDIEANDLYGTSCAYASGKSMAPVVLAFNDEAVMKVDGKIERFRLDPQCKEVKLGTGSRYLSNDRVLDLAVEGEGRQAGYETVNFDGSVKLSTADGLVLYETTGTVQCGS